MMDSQGSSQTSQDSTMTVVDDSRPEILYFAYGSNLSTEQMLQRCPHSTPVGLSFLKGWKWIINENGYANVVQRSAASGGLHSDSDSDSDSNSNSNNSSERHWETAGVYGLLYLMPPQDEENLDRFEGVPTSYEKLYLEVQYVLDGQGKNPEEMDLGRVKALVYVNLEKTSEAPPAKEYISRMERGIRDAVDHWGMSEEYADVVMRRFWR